MNDSIVNYKITTCNEMHGDDLNRFLGMILDNEYMTIEMDSYHLIEKGMKKLGEGMFGIVHEFIGSDGYEYAVKIARYIHDDEKKHDGQILEMLQGIKGYPKLFSYIDGELYSGRMFYVMICQKIKGFTIGSALYPSNSKELYSFAGKSDQKIVSIFESSINDAIERGITPKDTHSHNVMFNEEDGLVYIVDVGNFGTNKSGEFFSYDADYHKSNSSLNKIVKLADELKIEEEVSV